MISVESLALSATLNRYPAVHRAGAVYFLVWDVGFIIQI